MACKCGNKEFHAHQLCRFDVIVDEHNNWLRNSPDDKSACYDSETPYGTFICTSCGAPYEEIPTSDNK